MAPQTLPTLFALSTGARRAGLAVVRVSGPGAKGAIEKLCRPAELPPPGKMALRDIVDPQESTLVDRGLVVRFSAPASFTGEDVVEFHVHGGPAVVDGLLKALAGLAGFEPAPPGAFTRRAFENGKMDLTEAEGLADLIEAETAQQRRQALRQMDGALGHLYNAWAERLTFILARTEAQIDFADEEDIPKEITENRAQELAELLREIETHLNDSRRGEKIREGFFIALLGAPNAGKSSLLNALVRHEAAIVAETPGTTRDVIEVRLDLGGWPVTIADTAGLRESADAVETEGVRRALARARTADLKILLFDGTQEPDAQTLALQDADALAVINKADLMAPSSESFLEGIPLSAKTGQGLAAFEARLEKEIEKRFTADEAPVLTRARHREALEACREHLLRAQRATETELAAEDLRLAVRALGRITGAVDVEDLLDIIFSAFCVGK